MSIHARQIGAINTVIPMRTAFDGVGPPPAEFWKDRCRAGPVVGLYGDNTDWVGIARSILPNLSPANAITAKTSALIIGAGCMARAALYALIQLGVRHVAIYNRTVPNAVRLAQYFNELEMSTDSTQNIELILTGSGIQLSGHNIAPKVREVRVLESRECRWYSDISQPTIVISCVPVPHASQANGWYFTLPPGWMQSPTGGVVLDLNYRPHLTPLLRQARQQMQRGWVAVDGLENVVAQANAQFELFTGRRPPQALASCRSLAEM